MKTCVYMLHIINIRGGNLTSAEAPMPRGQNHPFVMISNISNNDVPPEVNTGEWGIPPDRRQIGRGPGKMRKNGQGVVKKGKRIGKGEK